MSSPRRIEPEPGQESVWDYPRPPRVDECSARAQIWHDCRLIADSSRALRVLETYHAPTIYLPAEDVLGTALDGAKAATRSEQTMCEWKGLATYFDVVSRAMRAERAAWTYRDPLPGFESIAGYVAFHPRAVDCFLDGEQAFPQPGRFYGGWVTSVVSGPFKGAPEMAGW